MKDKKKKIQTFDTEEKALITCGMYEFENAWVCKLMFNHIEPPERDRK
jgi:hypothetical protein